MTQQEVVNLLKEKKDWITIKEINEILNYNSAQANLSKLYEQGLVIREVCKSKKGNVFLLYKLK